LIPSRDPQKKNEHKFAFDGYYDDQRESIMKHRQWLSIPNFDLNTNPPACRRV
jgi:hypothetical protein